MEKVFKLIAETMTFKTIVRVTIIKGYNLVHRDTKLKEVQLTYQISEAQTRSL